MLVKVGRARSERVVVDARRLDTTIVKKKNKASEGGRLLDDIVQEGGMAVNN